MTGPCRQEKAVSRIRVSRQRTPPSSSQPQTHSGWTSTFYFRIPRHSSTINSTRVVFTPTHLVLRKHNVEDHWLTPQPWHPLLTTKICSQSKLKASRSERRRLWTNTTSSVRVFLLCLPLFLSSAFAQFKAPSSLSAMLVVLRFLVSSIKHQLGGVAADSTWWPLHLQQRSFCFQGSFLEMEFLGAGGEAGGVGHICADCLYVYSMVLRIPAYGHG